MKTDPQSSLPPVVTTPVGQQQTVSTLTAGNSTDPVSLGLPAASLSDQGTSVPADPPASAGQSVQDPAGPLDLSYPSAGGTMNPFPLAADATASPSVSGGVADPTGGEPTTGSKEGSREAASPGGKIADLAKKLASWKKQPQAPASSPTFSLPSGASDSTTEPLSADGPLPAGTPAAEAEPVESGQVGEKPVQDALSSDPLPPAPAQPVEKEKEAIEGTAAGSVPPMNLSGTIAPAWKPSPIFKTSPAVRAEGVNPTSSPAGTVVQQGDYGTGTAQDSGPKSPSDVLPTAKEAGSDIDPITGTVSLPVLGKVKRGSYPYTIEQLLDLVVEKEASDLHISVGYPSMIRIDGKLMPVGQELVTEGDINGLILPVLPENKRELLEVNREVDLAYAHRQQARFRINAFYTKGTISGAFRLIPNKIRNIEELKLPGVYHQFTQLPQGMVLVTGPTGHGKSTTLAAMLQEINENYPKHIITIEDPIEYVYPRARALVDQREMHEDTHSWEIALRSAMREDPDVILVGEMRDYETIAAAITLAETGHLVFATLHTNSAAQTIDRVIDVFPEHQQAQVRMQMSVILEAIVSQRLIPIQKGGRRAVSEVLLATGAVRNLIREGKTHQVDNVIRTSLDVGMKTLEHSLVDLIREGVITIDEAENVALHPEEVVRLLKV